MTPPVDHTSADAETLLVGRAGRTQASIFIESVWLLVRECPARNRLLMSPDGRILLASATGHPSLQPLLTLPADASYETLRELLLKALDAAESQSSAVESSAGGCSLMRRSK